MAPSPPQDESNDAAEALAKLSLDAGDAPKTEKSTRDNTEPTTPPCEWSSKVHNHHVNCLFVKATVLARRTRLTTEEVMAKVLQHLPGPGDMVNYKVSEYLLRCTIARGSLTVDENHALLALDM